VQNLSRHSVSQCISASGQKRGTAHHRTDQDEPLRQRAPPAHDVVSDAPDRAGAGPLLATSAVGRIFASAESQRVTRLDVRRVKEGTADA